jgi:hypothetical protein
MTFCYNCGYHLKLLCRGFTLPGGSEQHCISLKAGRHNVTHSRRFSYVLYHGESPKVYRYV